MREKLVTSNLNTFQAGITPACAGKTLLILLKISLLGDHPRVCGKNELVQELVIGWPGSPPRVREKQIKLMEGILVRRITPACAGKTEVGSDFLAFVWDHPRVCGKNPVVL